jgi:hypothetical protein
MLRSYPFIRCLSVAPGSQVRIPTVAGTDEELEGAGCQAGAQDGVGWELIIENESQTRVSLRFVQRPLVAGKELGQDVVLDAQ